MRKRKKKKRERRARERGPSLEGTRRCSRQEPSFLLLRGRSFARDAFVGLLVRKKK